jgi:signal transduction histidine kinase
METLKQSTKIGLIAILIVIVTILHYSSAHGGLGAHIAHRELYFIPILLCSFWFGLKPGIATSAAISVIYAPHVFSSSATDSNLWSVIFQILMFNVVAIILGYLVERGKRQQAQMIASEKSAALGLAATAIGHEMKDLLNALKSISSQTSNPEYAELNRDFEKELTRLEQMVDIISTFKTSEPLRLFSHDLNTIIQERIKHHLAEANKNGVTIKTHLDDKGCPAQVDPESLRRVFDRIIQNALEASSRGQTIHIQSLRKGDHCEVAITDEGLGISSENLQKIFKPFFTTKENRDGLSLSASYKTVKDMGGEIKVQSNYGKGAEFTVIIPREDSGKRITHQLGQQSVSQ